MKVALTAEGTYPHQYGGVSVWCDQLIRGMPGRVFEVLPVVATGSEPMRWALPRNVSSVRSIPLWGPASALPSAHRRSRAEPPVEELLRVLLLPPAQAQDRFVSVLRALFDYAQAGNLSRALASERSVRLLSQMWRGRLPGPYDAAPTLDDAATMLHLLEHALRPLAYPPAEADVAHAVTNGLGALPALTSHWAHGTPIVVTEHGIYMREQYLHSRTLPYRWPVRSLYLRFLRRLCATGYGEAELITPSNVFNVRWEQQLGADLTKVRTIYNGVAPDDFPAIDDEPDVPTISWAGRIDPVKDVETLVRSFALVRKAMPEARLRIFGSPPGGDQTYLERCKALAADLGLNGSVAFEGRVGDIREAYAAGHVVALCSISEGFPFTVIEAMTCGRPCVVTDVGGVPEAIGDTGLVVPPRNPEALAQGLLTLLGDGDMRRELGAAARIRALALFTVDRAVSAFGEIYDSLESGGSGGTGAGAQSGAAARVRLSAWRRKVMPAQAVS
jgi:polysaccharide biosynthesis protein PelF